MIGTFFLMMLTLILAVVHGVFSGFGYILPTQITDSISYFMSYLNYLKGILPISDILLAFIAYITAWGLVYTVKLLFLVINNIPFLRLKLHLPKDETVSTGYDNRGRKHKGYTEIF